MTKVFTILGKENIDVFGLYFPAGDSSNPKYNSNFESELLKIVIALSICT